jgi:cathepsin L
MRVLIALIAVAAVATALPLSGSFEQPHGYTFEQYLVDFGKSYETAEEYALHQNLFNQRVQEVIEHNAKGDSWKKGVNQFTDMTEKEMSQFFGVSAEQVHARHAARAKMPFASYTPLPVLPDSVDWRTKNVVSPVKNQGGCGSCWAFAATETIESAVAIATGKLPLLSTQNMVSCTQNPQHCGGTGGCDGATAELGIDYVAQKGISSEADYPYTARTGTCREIKKTATVTGFVKLIENNYTDLINAVAAVGPIAVSVAADPWMAYSSGVFSGCPKAPRNVIINHGVQLVGYGTDAGKDYWIVRNSWGASWGEKGYIRVLKTNGSTSQECAVDNRPQDGSGCDGGPPQVTVCGACGIWYDNCYATGAKLV